MHTKPEIPVFISNLPTECLESCRKQKYYFERNGASWHVRKIVQRKGGLITYVDSDESVKCLSESVNKVPGARAVYRVQTFLAVAKFFPTGTSKDDIIVDYPSIMDIMVDTSTCLLRILYLVTMP